MLTGRKGNGDQRRPMGLMAWEGLYIMFTLRSKINVFKTLEVSVIVQRL